jgi:hypothetical protein
LGKSGQIEFAIAKRRYHSGESSSKHHFRDLHSPNIDSNICLAGTITEPRGV